MYSNNLLPTVAIMSLRDTSEKSATVWQPYGNGSWTDRPLATRRITDQTARRAKPCGAQHDVRDSVVRGLVLRIYETGARTWGVLYRTEDGRRRWFKLGSYPSWSVRDARKRAEEIKGLVAKGEDPQADRESSRQRRNVETIAELADRFLERYSR